VVNQPETPSVSGMLTIRDLAHHLKLSPMTVSRALRDGAGVAPTTRERVVETAQRLGYRRNEAARNLRLGGKTGLIGLIVTNLANPFYSRLALGVESVIESRGLKVLLSNTAENPSRERLLVEDLIDRQVEGIIVVPAGSEHKYLAGRAGGPAVVFASRPPHGVQADSVLIDDFGGAREATRQLIEAGHRRIGYVGVPPSVYTGAERFRGFCAALESAGIPLNRRLVVQGCLDVDDAQKATTRLMAMRRAPTAFFTATNRLTLGALLASNSGSATLDFAGFDDVEYALLLPRPPITVGFDADEIGRQAGRLLLDRLDTTLDYTESPPRRIYVPTTVGSGRPGR